MRRTSTSTRLPDTPWANRIPQPGRGNYYLRGALRARVFLGRCVIAKAKVTQQAENTNLTAAH